MSSCDESSVRVQTPRPGVLLITIDRPEARNAIDLRTAEGIASGLDHLDEDPQLTTGVITGAGGVFSAGMDLKAFAATGAKPRVGDRGFAGIVRRSSRKPLLAAVEGFAIAGGFEIALACDMLVAASDSRMGIPEAKLGLVAAGGALRRLPRRMPQNIVAELAFTGDLVPAQRLYDLGVINHLTSPGAALERALDLAVSISRNAPLALEATKAVLERERDWPEDRFWDLQAQITEPVLDSEDAAEGARAFVERREPQWARR